MPKKLVDPLPVHTVEEVIASQKAPLPDGVTMVRMNKCVTGLQIHADGAAVLERPDRPWRPLSPVTKVSRGAVIRSRVKLRFADGGKATLRPYKPGHKGLIEVGRRDTIYVPSSSGTGDGRNDSSLDSVAGVFVILVAIVLFPISLVMLGRELLGISARAKQAGLLLPQLRAIAREG
jgi:hypothetical protein